MVHNLTNLMSKDNMSLTIELG